MWQRFGFQVEIRNGERVGCGEHEHSEHSQLLTSHAWKYCQVSRFREPHLVLCLITVTDDLQQFNSLMGNKHQFSFYLLLVFKKDQLISHYTSKILYQCLPRLSPKHIFFTQNQKRDFFLSDCSV